MQKLISTWKYLGNYRVDISTEKYLQLQNLPNEVGQAKTANSNQTAYNNIKTT